MTGTDRWTPRQRQVAASRDPYAPWPCVIYLVVTQDPWVGYPGRDKAVARIAAELLRVGVVLPPGLIVGYVGEAGAHRVAARWEEHRAQQWWAPGIAEFRLLEAEFDPARKVWVPLPTAKVFGNKAQVWQWERWLVETCLPPLNLEYNGANPWLVKDGRGVHRDLPQPRPVWWPTDGAVRPAQVSRPRVAASKSLPVPNRPLSPVVVWWRSIRGWVYGVPAGWVLGSAALTLGFRVAGAPLGEAVQAGPWVGTALAAGVVWVRLQVWRRARRRRLAGRRAARTRRMRRR